MSVLLRLTLVPRSGHCFLSQWALDPLARHIISAPGEALGRLLGAQCLFGNTLGTLHTARRASLSQRVLICWGPRRPRRIAEDFSEMVLTRADFITESTTLELCSTTKPGKRSASQPELVPSMGSRCATPLVLQSSAPSANPPRPPRSNRQRPYRRVLPTPAEQQILCCAQESKIDSHHV